MKIYKSIFLSNEKSLKSEVTGGVQICSQEFHSIISNCDWTSVEDYYVPFTKRVWDRIRIKIGQENYSMYDVAKHQNKLVEFIKVNKINLVFVNMASLIRFAKPIKEEFGDAVKLVLLSHGNHSGDYLHLLSKPLSPVNGLKKLLMKFRLGNLLATESEFRVKYFDVIVALSETEKQIENWFGAPKSIFFPRRLYCDFVEYNPVFGRVGFVGRLDHPPNLIGIKRLLNELNKSDTKKLEFRLVGAPREYGDKLSLKYPFVNYLGELSDADLDKEAASWCAFLNPVWWYSTGATTKIAKAISWGIPIITTLPGIRGYDFKGEKLIEVSNEFDMCREIHEISNNLEKAVSQSLNVRKIASEAYTIAELGQMLKTVVK